MTEMSDDKVVNFTGITTLDLPPERVLKGALEADLESVTIVGYTKDGQEYFASSVADGAFTVWLFERFKKQLLEIEL